MDSIGDLQNHGSAAGSGDRRWSRRGLLASAVGAALGLSAHGPGSAAGGQADSTKGAPGTAAEPGAPGRFFPQQDRDEVLEVVTRAHFDADRVRELVEARPALARASWDWGYGDWESALGAASHMGRRDIAEILIAHGARPNLFTAAMLGHLEVVRATVEARPGVQGIRGPHALTLLHHARSGGEAARPVVEYLVEVGGADPPLPGVDLAADEAGRYAGRYRFGPGPADVLEVSAEDGILRIARPPAAPRVLHALGDHAFFPAGAQAVRIRFEAGEADEPARAVTVHDPDLLARGVRER